MFVSQPLDLLPFWAVYIVTVVILLVFLEAGYQLGKAMRKRWPDKSESGVGAMVGAALALLGFLLAFVTSIAIDVYNERRQLVITEADAIGTTFLRAGFLDEPARSESRELLREYVNTRLSALDPVQLNQAITRSEEIHAELWQLAEVNGRANPVPTVALYITTLNEVIDLHTMRINAELGFRVPPTIVWGLYLVAVLTMGLVGLHSSYSEKRNLLSQVIMVLILSVTFVLIVDLDRSQQGLLRIPYKALIDLQQMLNRAP
jgi:hypothetical protein